MRPYIFGIALLSCWTFIAAGVVANLAGVEGVGNRPIVLVPVDGARMAPLDTAVDASVPFADSVTSPADRGRL